MGKWGRGGGLVHGGKILLGGGRRAGNSGGFLVLFLKERERKREGVCSSFTGGIRLYLFPGEGEWRRVGVMGMYVGRDGSFWWGGSVKRSVWGVGDDGEGRD